MLKNKIILKTRRKHLWYLSDLFKWVNFIIMKTMIEIPKEIVLGMHT